MSGWGYGALRRSLSVSRCCNKQRAGTGQVATDHGSAQRTKSGHETLYNRSDGTRAVAARTLTAGDVLARLARIGTGARSRGPGVYARGQLLPQSHPRGRPPSGWRCHGHVHTNDHPPYHHVQRSGETDVKISLETVELLEPVPAGGPAKNYAASRPRLRRAPASCAADGRRTTAARSSVAVRYCRRRRRAASPIGCGTTTCPPVTVLPYGCGTED